MEIIQTIFQSIIDLGAPVFLPIILTIIGTLLGMKFSKAFAAGLILGVALVGMGMVMDFMTANVGAAAQAFIKNTGVELKALDMGWAPALGLVWTWEYAFLMFPVQIIINVLMLAFNLTNCLNMDMWNVANKVCTAFLITYVSGNIYLGFALAILQCILELKNADYTRYRLEKLSGIPGVSMPHPMFLAGIWFYPFTHLMDVLLPDKVNIDAQKIRDKIGVFGENHIMGFLVGCFIGIFGGYDIPAILTLGVQAGTALTLFPLVAKLFTTSLTPISEGATEFMKRKFAGREFTIGLDWPIMAGRSEHWLLMILAIPVIFIYAIFLPGNIVLPFGGLMEICLIVPLFYLTMGNLVKMAIGTLIGIPIHLYAASYFAPHFTKLAETTGGATVPKGQMLAWLGMDISELRWIFATASQGNVIGIVFAVVTIPLAIYYFKSIKKEDQKYAAELGYDIKPK
ncbi:PTS galactitol transporter subunit IIC [Vagococcus sp. BWB3-3]|uniref:PTS galactitol transporter subunit IIC n=1 Tax=Vagococcus allomyrinae TaxID=2794353 RepID=A0A940P636_9ENTE|nr:PTS transporter subunit IIC [Vagococcus allomyrinae]MBP1042304.1 PTS galactitol transporter subunit IIC [Vagococcus allomyrinae]